MKRSIGLVAGIVLIGAFFFLSGEARAVFIQEHKLSATGYALSAFTTVAVSSDGTRLAIGNNGAVGGGAVYIFLLSSGSWSLEQTLVGGDTAAGDSFGIAVSFTDDASRVLIGAHLDDDGGSASGAAYVFSRSGTTWTQEQKLIASDDAAGGNFGEHLDISADGTRLVVGSKGINASRGAAYVFSRSGTTWTEEQKVVASDGVAGDQYGTSVAVDTDATRIIVGAPQDDDGGANSGAAYVASRSGTTWTEEQKLIASDDAAGDLFGTHVDIADDGTRVIVGAYQDDSFRGSAYVFSRSGIVWTEEQKLTASDGAGSDFFSGGSDNGVHLSSDGSEAIVSAYGDNSNQGAVYHYTRSVTTWTEAQKITASDGESGDYFSISSDFQPDGVRFVVIAQFDNSFTGSAYVFGPGQTLYVVFAGTGSGTVDSSPSGIDGCTADCDAVFAQDEVVTLTATPDADSDFSGWTGDADCADGSVTMSTDVSCTATFDLGPQLDITSGGSGVGTVTSAPVGIDCGADCSENFTTGTVVTLTATPGAGSTFAGWTGDADCADGSVTMSTDVSCTATFNRSQSGAGSQLTPQQRAKLFDQLYPNQAAGRAIPSNFNLREGDLITSHAVDGDPDVYIVNDAGYKRLFLNPAIFGFYGHLGGYAAVKQVTPSTRDAFITSGLFRNCETGDGTVYATEVTAEDQGVLHHVSLAGGEAEAQDPEFFLKVFCINSNEFGWYPKGLPFSALNQVPTYRRW